MTWNVRLDALPDNITLAESIAALPDPVAQPAEFYAVNGEQPWSARRMRIYERILTEEVDIFGLQEAMVRQVNDMSELLGAGWGHVGVGREDGIEEGEFMPIYWKKDTFTLLRSDHFWLSHDPFVPGTKFPGASSVRVATAAHFKLNSWLSNKRFTLVNTHLDDQSDPARAFAASMLLQRARSEAANSSTVFIMGDFNSQAQGHDASAYQIMVGLRAPEKINATFEQAFPAGKKKASEAEFKMIDVRTQLPPMRVAGCWATFTGFDAKDTSEYSHIDFIFGGSNGGWNITSHRVENVLTDDGVFASDHRPVIADILL